MPRSKGADSEETWAALMKAANDLLMRDGISRLSLRGVARAAGLRLGTLQYYFPKKESLIEALLGDSYKNVREFVEQVRAPITTEGLEDRFAGLASGFYKAARQYRHLSRARITTNLVAGRMSGPSRKSLERTANVFADEMEADRGQLRLAVHIISALSLRLASHSPEELQWATGADTREEAHVRVERMLCVLTKALVADLIADSSTCPARE